MTIQFKVIASPRSWLHTQPQRDRDRVARQEIRRAATRALAEIDAAVADRARPTGSTCGRCRRPISAPTWQCAHCGPPDVWTRATSDARAYGLDKVYQFDGMPIEFSHHDGAIISIR